MSSKEIKIFPVDSRSQCMSRFYRTHRLPDGKDRTVVRVVYDNGFQTVTFKAIRWSKYRLINWFIKLYIKIKY